MANISFVQRRFVSAFAVLTASLLVWGTAFGGHRARPVRGLLELVPFSDKLGHLLLYGVVAFGIAILSPTRRVAVGAATALLALGIADEFRQLTEYGRTFSSSDVVANAAGIGLGLAVAVVVRQRSS